MIIPTTLLSYISHVVFTMDKESKTESGADTSAHIHTLKLVRAM